MLFLHEIDELILIVEESGLFFDDVCLKYDKPIGRGGYHGL